MSVRRRDPVQIAVLVCVVLLAFAVLSGKGKVQDVAEKFLRAGFLTVLATAITRWLLLRGVVGLGLAALTPFVGPLALLAGAATLVATGGWGMVAGGEGAECPPGKKPFRISTDGENFKTICIDG